MPKITEIIMHTANKERTGLLFRVRWEGNGDQAREQ